MSSLSFTVFIFFFFLYLCTVFTLLPLTLVLYEGKSTHYYDHVGTGKEIQEGRAFLLVPHTTLSGSESGPFSEGISWEFVSRS